MKIRHRVSGLGSFGAALSRIAEPHSLTEILAGEADGIRNAAIGRLGDGQGAGSRSGALAESLAVHSSDDGLRFTISTPLEYGWHLEFGSLHSPPSPWLAPALDEQKPAILARIGQWLTASAKGKLFRR